MNDRIPFHKSIRNSDEIYHLKKYKEKIAKMKSEGTYCDPSEPDMSHLNFRMQSCMKCPHYEECKEKYEERMLRGKKKSKPKTKRCRCKK